MGSPRQRTHAALALAIVLAGSGCAATSSRDPGVYAISRECYFESDSAGSFLASSLSNNCSEEAAVVALAVFALPFVLDTALLPVTVPHDLLAR